MMERQANGSVVCDRGFMKAIAVLNMCNHGRLLHMYFDIYLSTQMSKGLESFCFVKWR